MGIASFALELSLCACCWRVYKGLRVSGLYPPDSDVLQRGAELPRHDEVSPFEMLCESEEAQLLQNYECRSDSIMDMCHASERPPVGQPMSELKELKVSNNPQSTSVQVEPLHYAHAA